MWRPLPCYESSMCIGVFYTWVLFHNRGGSCVVCFAGSEKESWKMAASPSKVYRVGEDLKETDCAVVHGVVKSVSPVKTSKAGGAILSVLFS